MGNVRTILRPGYIGQKLVYSTLDKFLGIVNWVYLACRDAGEE